MQYEVENKFAVVARSHVVDQLQAMGAEFREEIEQVDLYFAHPLRDFAQTDEALRIRRIGETNLITYKGPKIDTATKTRHEIELPLAAGSALVRDYAELLVALGFRRVAEVRKRRRGGQLRWHQWSVELALDDVAELGEFIELEIVVDQDQLAAAQSAVLTLATQLQLAEPLRQSYLEMVLVARGEA